MLCYLACVLCYSALLLRYRAFVLLGTNFYLRGGDTLPEWISTALKVLAYIACYLAGLALLNLCRKQINYTAEDAEDDARAMEYKALRKARRLARAAQKQHDREARK